MKKMVIALSALALVSGAQAANNTFKFRVFSSGADIFPCNAGIVHSGTHAEQGYTVDTTNPNYNGYGSEVVDSETNTSVSGSYLPDYMSYDVVEFDEWTENQTLDHSGKEFSKYAGTQGSYSWQAIFKDNSYLNLNQASDISYNNHKINDVNYIVSSLDFVLSSENYGAKYFVDICYYGPQFAPSTTGNRVYNLTSKVSFSNMVNGRDYLNKANVSADVQVYCDGEYKTSKMGQAVSAASQEVFYNNHQLVGTHSEAPAKCVVRYTFSENSEDRRNHAAHGGIFTLFTDITDPANI